MALAATKKHRVLAPRNSQEKEVVILLNLVVTAIAAITAKLDADGGVTDTNYTSTLVDDILYKLGNTAGTAVTAQ